MTRARMRVCSEPGCPNTQREHRCLEHRRQVEQARGTTAQRGYGSAHQHTRKAWRPAVEAGRVRCARCRRPIRPGQAWDLGHDDRDRSRYRGPEHVACNRATAGRASL
ncbi:hypothetical protein [Rhodococcus sp. HS-D2]|uniref:hypothetical protein n=1 Tax=Rhodococcus sp. HS-D2 TaxID=1384636 RepID=UPI0009EF1665|nr:hypothetical protein [Rhodococcus sp. HS-D2]